MRLRSQWPAHQGHILSLVVSADERWLFSAGDEGVVRIWDLLSGSASPPTTSSHAHAHPLPPPVPTCVLLLYAGADCGDIHAMGYSESLRTLYLGCKDASIQVGSSDRSIDEQGEEGGAHCRRSSLILALPYLHLQISMHTLREQWFNMEQRHGMDKQHMESEWNQRDHRFFRLHSMEEVVPIYGGPPVAVEAAAALEMETFVLLESMIMPLSHHGFVYALLVERRLPAFDHDVLISASGTCVRVAFGGGGRGVAE